MILLSNTIDGKFIIIGSIIIVLCAISGTFFLMINLKKKAKKEAEEFIKGFSDKFYSIIVKTINITDINDLKVESVEEYESKILNDIYNIIYTYFTVQIMNAINDTSISSMAGNILLDKNYIVNFVKQIYISSHVDILIKEAWAKYFESKVNKLEEVQDISIGHDIDGNEIIYSGNDYNEDFDEKNDLPPVVEEEIDKEALGKIIPPSEDENIPYNEETSDDIDYFIDKNGRKRNKNNGRFVK